jgi:hypothetical protein
VAFLDGDIVTPHTAQNVFLTPQRPTFGIVEDRGGVDVLWEHGLLAAGLNINTLDLVYDPNVTGVPFIGKVVGIYPATTGGVQVKQRSPEFEGVVVSVYFRQQAGTGTPRQYALVKLFNGGWREAWVGTSLVAGEVVVLDDR